MSDVISVIIPTFNSEISLESCLESISIQKLVPFEIIIVDNFSQDRTKDIADQFDVVFILERSNVSEARNIGLEKSRGRYVLFLDADQVLQPGVFGEIVELMEDLEFGCLIIPEESGNDSYWERCLGFEKRLKTLTGREYPRLFSRRVLDDFGGYDPELRFGEDMDLYFRVLEAGVKVGHTESRIIHNEFNGMINQLKKYVYYGEHSGPILRKYPSSRVFSQFNLHSTGNIIQHYINDPGHGVGFIFLRILRGISTLYGMTKSWMMASTNT